MRSGLRGATCRAVRVEARAKLNLGLAVGPLRPDAFHEIATVFQSISLADSLVIRPRARGFSLGVRFEDAAFVRRGSSTRRVGAVPRGPENLVLQAAQLLRARGLVGGARFELVKRIPSQAGLGGGSADAAAALVGLARLYGVRMSPRARWEWAATLGADVPFQTAGGTALGVGRGDRLRSLRLDRPLRALVAVPTWRVSTATAYGRLDRGKYALTEWKAKLRFAQSLGSDAVRPRDALRLGNSFEAVLGDQRRAFDSLCERLRRAGLANPRMSGSGSSVFGILQPGASARALVERFEGTETLYAVHSARRALRVVVDR
jgi:4-diphosphocytidyl-2-C-methyl-D-erythritol kinase